MLWRNSQELCTRTDKITHTSIRKTDRGAVSRERNPMKAAVYQGIGRISLEEVPKPQCPSDGLLLRVKACGICGTDVRTYYNGDERARPPWILGHEVAGIMEEVGEKARDVNVEAGARIHVISTFSCGYCQYCRMGMENLCENHKLLGYDPFPGGYADYMVVPQIGLRNVMEVPDDLSLELATLTDPLSDALNGVEQLDVHLGDKVVVIGAGPIGTMQAQTIRARGAELIILVDLNRNRLELARKVLGDDKVTYLDSSQNDVAETVMAKTEGRGADRIVVACSSVQAQEEALKMAARKGRILFFGGLPATNAVIEFSSNFLHYRELTVVGAYASVFKQQKLASELIRTGAIDAEKIITQKLPLSRIEEGFELIKNGDALKVVILPEA